MGGDRLALLPKGTSKKPGKKLLSGVGKRKGSSSWVSDFRGHSWSGPCSSLGNPTGISEPSSANCPCRGSKNATCWGLSAQRLLSDVCEWGAVTPTPTAAWDDQVRRAPADTRENQRLHCKTDRIWKPWVCSTDLHLQTYPLPGFCSIPQALWKNTFLQHT